MKIYIYKIYFPTSDKCYVGQTMYLQRRMKEHLRSGHAICRALNKYDDWEVSILHICKLRDEANRVEIEEICNFNSVSPNGYNLTSGGKAGTPSEETKDKIRQAALGRHPSEETKKILSVSGMGKKKPGTSQAMLGNQYAKGYKNTAMSERNKSMNKTPTHIQKCKLTKLKKYVAKLEQELRG